MKKSPVPVFVFLMTGSVLSAQPMAGGISEADEQFAHDRFSAALPYYLELYKADSSGTTLNHKIGVCYLNSRSQKYKAIRYLEKAVAPASPAAVYISLGDAYLTGEQFDRAIVMYEKAKKIWVLSKNKEGTTPEVLNWKIDLCRIGKKLQGPDTSRADQPSPAPDRSPVVSFDGSGVVFTFLKPGVAKERSSWDGKYFEEALPYNRVMPITPRTVLDTTTYKNECTVATSVDGQVVLTYKDDNGNAELYLTRLTGNQWSAPELLGKPINTKGWEPNEFISPDGYTLYFTSSRPGGFGGKDIYVCKRLPCGEWGKAANLGSTVNSPFDEEAPFIYSDGTTLFFSSNRTRNSCCFDVFSSTLLTDGSWTEPVKVGYPARKAGDAILYAEKSADKKIPVAVIKEDVNDMYLATFINQKAAPFTVLKGKVMDENGKVPSAVMITVTDNETGEVTGIYRVNYRTGEYLIPLPAGKNNNIRYESEGFLFQSENMDISKKAAYFETHPAVQLSPLASGSTVVLKNLFFDFDRATLRPVSHVELNKIFMLLAAYPRMSIELSYHIDAKGGKYIEKLAQDRAQAVVNYLIGKGIAKERVAAKAPEKMKLEKSKDRPDKKEASPEDPLRQGLELKITQLK